MYSRPARLLRGSVAAAVSTFIAAVAHAAGGDVFPHPLLLLAGFSFSVLFCVALTGRHIAWSRIVPSVVASQGLFHLIFSTAGTGSTRLVSTVDHSHHQLVVAVGASGHAMHSDGWMVLAHLSAAALTILALRYGERAFWSLFHSARLAVAALFTSVVPTEVDSTVSRPVTIGARVEPHRLAEFLCCVTHRGPPAGILFA